MGRPTLAPPEDLVATELEIDGHTFVLFEWTDAARCALDGLSEAERDVASGILAGESNATIAGRRKTSMRTVANQVASIFKKLRVQSRTELIAFALRSTRPKGTP